MAGKLMTRPPEKIIQRQFAGRRVRFTCLPAIVHLLVSARRQKVTFFHQNPLSDIGRPGRGRLLPDLFPMPDVHGNYFVMASTANSA